MVRELFVGVKKHDASIMPQSWLGGVWKYHQIFCCCLQILEAQQRLAAGEQFATVATQMSEDKARQGGDLGWKRRQEVVGAFADAAFKLEVTVFFSFFFMLFALIAFDMATTSQSIVASQTSYTHCSCITRRSQSFMMT